ncbi:MAG: metallophosphoesterase family protein [Bacteroidota bacterium]
MYQTRSRVILTVLLLLAGFSVSCEHIRLLPDPQVVEVQDDTVIFAVIGDYGLAGEAEEAVAQMVKSWDPDFIITTGDNNYPAGEFTTLYANIGQYYQDYIYNPDAPEQHRCTGLASDSAYNRFFPCPGNHDAGNIRGLTPYLSYFTLPGQELYYSFIWGDAEFFSINSLSDLSFQEKWLGDRLRASTRKFRIVYFHHAPYSPGSHGDSPQMQWPFHSMGADLVLSGHDHIYARVERSDEPGLHYIVTGAGGKSLYSCDSTRLQDPPFSCVSTSEDYSAVYVRITGDELYLACFLIGSQEQPFDELLIRKP